MNAAAPTWYAPPPEPQPEPGSGWPRWLIVGTVVWAVLLAALTWRSARNDEPTVREQRSLSEAVPVVDRAIGALVAAAGAEPVVLLGPDRLDEGCRITPFSDGAVLARTVEVVGGSDDVAPLLERVAAGLPAEYQARVRPSDRGLRLRADAGEFVTITGEADGPGRARFTADTGCRPLGGHRPESAPAVGPEADALSRVLATLDRPEATPPELLTTRCPDGDRRARTVRVSTAPGVDPSAARTSDAAGTVVLDTPEVYAYRTGPVTVVVDHADDGVRLAAATGCAPDGS
ncbi:hypothetical protein ABT336_02030 [Micromonospora sp. NPDC000207]|uniref:hypothetical protein n=1 Tax=Micromonospora sp. NPDC000207 TaxID=3154246 RepID=UPI0033332987